MSHPLRTFIRRMAVVVSATALLSSAASPALASRAGASVNQAKTGTICGKSTVVRMPGRAAHTAEIALTGRCAVRPGVKAA